MEEGFDLNFGVGTDGIGEKNVISDGAQIKKERTMLLFRRSRLRLLYAVLAILFSIGLVILCLYVFLSAKTVTVTDSTIYTTEDIIASSGISLGENIYSFSKTEITENIVNTFPFIKDVKVYRHPPTGIELVIVEDSPKYYFEFCGEYFAISDALRILESAESADALTEKYEGIFPITLSGVVRAVEGEYIEFEKKNYSSYVLKVLSEFTDREITENINSINLSNKYDIYVIYAGRFKVKLGNTDNLKLKIAIANAVIEKISKNYKGTINVENDTAFFIMDNSIVLN